MKTSSKKLVSLLVCLAMVLAVLPMAVFAADYVLADGMTEVITIPAGGTVTIDVDASASEVNLLVNGNRMYYDWYLDTGRQQSYPNPGGVVEMTLPAGGVYTMSIVNVSAEAEQVVEVSVSGPSVGTEESPDALVMGENACEVDSWTYYFYSWTATEAGSLTIAVDTDVCNDWCFTINYTDVDGNMHYNDTVWSDVEPVTPSQTVPVQPGEVYMISVGTASAAPGFVVFNASFSTETTDAPDQGGDEEVPSDEPATYVISDVMLALGDNALELDPTVDYTIFEFCPEQTGVYKFTADDPNALVGYWGGGTFYVSDQTVDKTNSIEQSIGQVGPSIMVGICADGPVVLTVERTDDYELVEIPRVVYENEHEFVFFEANEDASYGSFNLMDNEREEIYECENGFLHYGSVDGPLLVADLSEFPISISGAAEYDGLNAIIEIDGETVKIDFKDAMMEYYDMGMYPVTPELAGMIQLVGESKDWWAAGGFVFIGKAPTYVEDAWLVACYYLDAEDYYIELPEVEEPEQPSEPEVPETPDEPSVPTEPSVPAEPTVPSKPVDPDDEEIEQIPVTADRSVLGLAVALAVATSAVVVLKKKED